MRISLIAGVFMVIGKTAAWLMTGSAAILSDAAESMVHMIAVAFAVYSLRLSFRPADNKFIYGYERVTFFSAGFEGAMIIVAALYIIIESIQRWRADVLPSNLGTGTALVAAASLANLILGMYLVRTGRKSKSLIVEAHGRHVLVDSWTSFGVVAGLLLVVFTGWKPADALVAIAVALNILVSGFHLIAQSVRGLMDYSDPTIADDITRQLDQICAELRIHYHHVRFRSTGNRLLIEVHLVFPYATPVGRAHTDATYVERRLAEAFPGPVDVSTHLESLEDHDVIHEEQEDLSKKLGELRR